MLRLNKVSNTVYRKIVILLFVMPTRRMLTRYPRSYQYIMMFYSNIVKLLSALYPSMLITLDALHPTPLKIVFGTTNAHTRSANSQTQRRKAANTHIAPQNTAKLTPPHLNAPPRCKSAKPTPRNALGMYAIEPCSTRNLFIVTPNGAPRRPTKASTAALSPL